MIRIEGVPLHKIPKDGFLLRKAFEPLSQKRPVEEPKVVIDSPLQPPTEEEWILAAQGAGGGNFTPERAVELGLVEQQQEPPKTWFEKLLGKRPKERNPIHFAEKLRELVGFEERIPGRLQFIKESLKLFRFRRELENGETETYEDALARTEKKTGKEDAVYSGVGDIDGTKFVLVGTHWDFLGGSIGTKEGQKIKRAIEYAARHNLPVVTLLSTGGIRQHDNTLGLWQMPELAHAIRMYKENVKQPFVSVAFNCWGGASASILPLGISGGIEGTDLGFSGRNVIATYTHTEVKRGEQSAEKHMELRNIDLVWRDEHDLYNWLKALFSVTKIEGREKVSSSDPFEPRHISTKERFPFGINRFYSILHDVERSEPDDSVVSQQVVSHKSRSDLYDQYRSLRDPMRPDAEYLMKTVFDEVVPLYSNASTEDFIWRPSIGIALARIGTQRFLVVGNLPRHQRGFDRIHTVPSNPEPADIRVLKRAYQWAEQLDYPVVVFANTPGMKPTLESEQGGIFREVAEIMEIADRFGKPTYNYIIGEGASAGLVGTASVRRRIVMTKEAMAYVADPTASAAIMNNTPTPTREQVLTALESMGVTAMDQVQFGLIDKIIAEPGGATEHPERIAFLIRRDLLQAVRGDHGVHPKKMHDKFRIRMRRLWARYLHD